MNKSMDTGMDPLHQAETSDHHLFLPDEEDPLRPRNIALSVFAMQHAYFKALVADSSLDSLMKITDYFPSTSYNNREDSSVISGSQSQEMYPAVNKASLTTQTPKKRKERFTDPEVHALVDTITENMGQLFGPKVSNAAAKAAIWDKVVARVNKNGEITRTLPECKKRWQDYRRKVKTLVDDAKLQASSIDEISWDDVLTKRQMIVAQFFKWDSNSTTLPNDSFLNEDDKWDSDDDFIFTQKEISPPHCLIVDSPKEVCVPHSSADEPKQPFDHRKTKTLKNTVHSSADVSKRSEHQKAKTSKEIMEPTSTVQQLPSWDCKLDQLIAQQQQTNEMLKTIRDSVSKSLMLQKRMSVMVKTNFLELQKSIMSNQKTSTEQSRALENTMKSLHTEMNEISNQLRVKHLQELMPDLDTGTSKPGRKRKLDKTPSSSGSLKKKLRKNDS